MPQLSQLEKQRTAKAWGMTDKEFAKIYAWVTDEVAPERRSYALLVLLRRHYEATVK